ncbi:MAG: Fe-S cluster assembly protein HesB [Candidatus Thorarchaeota archaeon]
MNLKSLLDADEIESFQTMIMDWWSENARDLPWRRDPTPYNVLVSEIMLQQTQVSRVIPKYLEFLQKYPTLESLAESNTKELVQIWCGLGYNRRALWLKDAAGQITERGSFPEEVPELRKLKGVGPYTSRSILIFAFNEDVAAVDTNIRRVLIASGFATEDTSEKDLQGVADVILLKGRSSDWHNALMDYGSDVLTSSTTGIAPTSKQPKFKGSTRQMRGKIVRILSENDSLTLSEIVSSLNIEGKKETELESILEQLICDKLVDSTDGRKYRIAE